MNSTGKKWAIGCALGCAGLLVATIVAVAFFASWVVRPGKLLEPVRLVGPDTIGFAEWTVRPDDPATDRFLELLLAGSRNLSDRDQTIPKLIDQIMKNQQVRQVDDLRRLLPISAGWTLRRRADDGREIHLFTLSLEGIGNRLRIVDWILGMAVGRDSQSEVRVYRDENIYSFRLNGDGIAVVFIRGNDLFFTSDLATAEAAIDLLLGLGPPTKSPPAAEVAARLLSAIPPDRSLRAAIGDGEAVRSVVAAVFAAAEAAPPDPQIWRVVQALAVHANLDSDGALAGTIELTTDPAEPDPSLIDRLAADLSRIDSTGQRLEIVPSFPTISFRIKMGTVAFSDPRQE